MRILLVLVSFCLPVMAAESVFTTWTVPWEQTRPRDPDIASDGKVWFVGQSGDYVAWLDPVTGKFTRIELPEGSGPHNLIVGKDGGIWIAGNKAGWLGKMNPEDGSLVQFSTAQAGIDDPHTLIQSDAGKIWFTAQWSNRIALFDPQTTKFQAWKIPSNRARPYGIDLDEKEQPWVALMGTHKLATVANGELQEIPLPREDARPRRVDVVKGRVWYVDYVKGYYGFYDPAKQSFTEWLAPSGKDAAPYGAVADAAGNFWFVETGPQPNRMIGVNTKTGEVFFNQEIPESGGAVRHMAYDAARNVIWFGMDTNFLGRLTLHEPGT